MIVRLMLAFFAISLVGSMFIGYTTNSTLTNLYPSTYNATNAVFQPFSNAAQSISQGSNIIDLLGGLAWGGFGVLKLLASVPGVILTFENETIAIIGIQNYFINALANIATLAAMAYVALALIEMARPGTTGVKLT